MDHLSIMIYDWNALNQIKPKTAGTMIRFLILRPAKPVLFFVHWISAYLSHTAYVGSSPVELVGSLSMIPVTVNPDVG
jgi:hypothetical protein